MLQELPGGRLQRCGDLRGRGPVMIIDLMVSTSLDFMSAAKSMSAVGRRSGQTKQEPSSEYNR